MRHAASLRVAYCSNNDKGLKLDRIERRSHKKTRSRLPSGELVKSSFNKIARVQLGESKDVRNLPENHAALAAKRSNSVLIWRASKPQRPFRAPANVRKRACIPERHAATRSGFIRPMEEDSRTSV